MRKAVKGSFVLCAQSDYRRNMIGSETSRFGFAASQSSQ
jgi:hypothetical protein